VRVPASLDIGGGGAITSLNLRDLLISEENKNVSRKLEFFFHIVTSHSEVKTK
jgi:hypothetical protein